MQSNNNSPQGLSTAEIWTLGIGLLIIIILIFLGGKLTAPPEPQQANSGIATANSTVSGGMLGTSTNSTNQTSTTMGTNISTDQNVQIYDEVVGTGATVKSGDTITANYTGTLADGTVFDASSKHGGALSFPIGVGQVIKGWDVGIVGMKVGGKRKLVITPAYGYGSQAVGPIPANSTLTFEVEVVGIK